MFSADHGVKVSTWQKSLGWKAILDTVRGYQFRLRKHLVIAQYCTIIHTISCQNGYGEKDITLTHKLQWLKSFCRNNNIFNEPVKQQLCKYTVVTLVWEEVKEMNIGNSQITGLRGKAVGGFL